MVFCLLIPLINIIVWYFIDKTLLGVSISLVYSLYYSIYFYNNIELDYFVREESNFLSIFKKVE